MSLKKFSFGKSVVCAVTGEEVTAVWAETMADALMGLGVSDEGLEIQRRRERRERRRGKAEDEQAPEIQETSGETRADD